MSASHSGVTHWYRVDDRDIIFAVDPSWDVDAGGAAGALASSVVGRNLIDCIRGDSTRMFIEAALQAVRLTASVRQLQYRCDAPGSIRHLRMVLTPFEHGEVLVEHFLVSEQARQALPPLRLSKNLPAVAALRRCSQCQLFQLAGTADWIEARADMPVFANALRRQESLDLEDVVCPRCAALASGLRA